MDIDVLWEVLLDILRRHWGGALFVSITLFTIAVFAAGRWLLRWRFRRMMEDRGEEDDEELDELLPLGPLDQQALEVIRELRGEVWSLPEAELQLNLETLNARASRVVRSIAAVYHPEAEAPTYEASLTELINLIRRVSSRLHRLADMAPFKLLGYRKLSEYQRYYQVYLKINEHPVLQFFKRNPQLYRVARWAINLKNLGNPFYWAGRELSREGYFLMIRWFTMTFISQVGREAMRLYSGRRFQTAEDRDAVLGCYRLFALSRQWEGPSPDEWAVLVGFIANHSVLEAEAKVHILSRCSQGHLPRDLEEQELQTRRGRRWFRHGLESLQDKGASPAKRRLLEEALADLEAESHDSKE